MYATPEHSDDLANKVKDLVQYSKSEEGLLDYYVSRDTKDQTMFHIFERWGSKPALQQHIERGALQSLIKSGWIKDMKSFVAKAY